MEPQITRRILRASTFVSLGMVCVVLTSFGRDALVARTFGASSAVDVYVVVFALLLYLPNIVALVAQASFVPVFSEALQTAPDRAWKMASSIFNHIAILFSVLGMVIFLAQQPLLHLMAPGFGPEQLALARRVLIVLLPLVSLTVLNEYLKTILNCLKIFWWPSWSQALPAGVAILAILLGNQRWGIIAVAIGTLIGVAVQTLVLLCLSGTARGNYSLTMRRRGTGLGTILSLGLPYMLVEFAKISALVVDRYFASTMEPGSITCLFLADRLLRVPLWVFAIPLLTSSHPYLSDKVNRDGPRGLQPVLERLVYGTTLICLPVAVCMAAGSVGLVDAVFRGGAFGERETLFTARLFMFMAPQVLLIAIYFLFDRVAIVLRDRLALFQVSAVMIGVKLFGSWLLMRFLGVVGLAVASDAMYFCAALVLYRAYRGHGGHLDLRAQKAEYAKVALVSALAGVILIALLKAPILAATDSWGMPIRLSRMGAFFLVGFASYFALGQAWRIRGLSLRELILDRGVGMVSSETGQ